MNSDTFILWVCVFILGCSVSVFALFGTDVLTGIRIDKLEQQVLQHTSADVNSQLPR